MPLSLSQEAVKERFKPLWALLDKNGDGALDLEEVCAVTRGNASAAAALMKQFGKEKDGKITFDEYMDMMIRGISSDEEVDQIVQSIWSKVYDGNVTNTFQHVLNDLGKYREFPLIAPVFKLGPISGVDLCFLRLMPPKGLVVSMGGLQLIARYSLAKRLIRWLFLSMRAKRGSPGLVWRLHGKAIFPSKFLSHPAKPVTTGLS